MTLLVGVLCESGAVIAADRQATHGGMGRSTVAQSVTKVRIINGDTLFASCGPVGLGQQFAGVIEAEHTRMGRTRFQAAAPQLQRKFREHLDPAFTTAGLAARVIGGAAQDDVLCGSLLATKFQDGLRLIEFSPQAGCEAMNAELPFICLGSGKPNADPFLGFLWSVYFGTRGARPNLNEAVLLAYWTVRVAIDLKSTGVGFDPDVFVLDLQQQAGGPLARALTEADLAEANEFIREAEAAMRSIRDRMLGVADGGSTLPPKLA